MLASILRQCQEASDANWLGLATVGSDGSENNWRESGSVENMYVLGNFPTENLTILF